MKLVRSGKAAPIHAEGDHVRLSGTGSFTPAATDTVSDHAYPAVDRLSLVQNGQVDTTSATRNTMYSGQLAVHIQLDSIAMPVVYRTGPLEYLRVELLVLDGKCSSRKRSMTI